MWLTNSTALVRQLNDKLFSPRWQTCTGLSQFLQFFVKFFISLNEWERQLRRNYDEILLKTLSYIVVYLRNTENATMKEPFLLIIAEYRNS